MSTRLLVLNDPPILRGGKICRFGSFAGKKNKEIVELCLSTLRSNEMQDTQTLSDGIVGHKGEGGKGVRGGVEDRRKICIVIILNR